MTSPKDPDEGGTQPTTIRFEPDVRARLDAYAAAKRQSMNAAVNDILSRALPPTGAADPGGPPHAQPGHGPGRPKPGPDGGVRRGDNLVRPNRPDRDAPVPPITGGEG